MLCRHHAGADGRRRPRSGERRDPQRRVRGRSEGWTSTEKEPVISSLSGEQAASGSTRSRSSTRRTSRGRRSALTSGRERRWELRAAGQVLPVSGSGLGIYVRQYDKRRKPVPGPEPHLRGLGGTGPWQSLAMPFYTSTTRLRSTCTYTATWRPSSRLPGRLRDRPVARGPAKPRGRPVASCGRADRASHPADVVGPDGIVYPNWTSAACKRGIPTVAGSFASGLRRQGGGRHR